MSKYGDTERRLRYEVRDEAEQSVKNLNIEDFFILPKRERFDRAVCYCGDDSMGIYLRNL